MLPRAKSNIKELLEPEQKDDELLTLLELPNPDHICISDTLGKSGKKYNLSDANTLARLKMSSWSESIKVRGKKLADVVQSSIPDSAPRHSIAHIKEIAEKTRTMIAEDFYLGEMESADKTVKAGQGLFVKSGKKINKGTTIVLGGGTIESTDFASDYCFSMNNQSSFSYGAFEPSNLLGKVQYAPPRPDDEDKEEQLFSPSNYKLAPSVEIDRIAYANVELIHLACSHGSFLAFKTTEDIVGPTGIYTSAYGANWWVSRHIAPYLFYTNGEVLGPSQARFMKLELQLIMNGKQEMKTLISCDEANLKNTILLNNQFWICYTSGQKIKEAMECKNEGPDNAILSVRTQPDSAFERRTLVNNPIIQRNYRMRFATVYKIQIEKACDQLKNCTQFSWIHHTYKNQLFMFIPEDTKCDDIIKHLLAAGLNAKKETHGKLKILVINEVLDHSVCSKIAKLKRMLTVKPEAPKLSS